MFKTLKQRLSLKPDDSGDRSHWNPIYIAVGPKFSGKRRAALGLDQNTVIISEENTAGLFDEVDLATALDIWKNPDSTSSTVTMQAMGKAANHLIPNMDTNICLLSRLFTKKMSLEDFKSKVRKFYKNENQQYVDKFLKVVSELSIGHHTMRTPKLRFPTSNFENADETELPKTLKAMIKRNTNSVCWRCLQLNKEVLIKAEKYNRPVHFLRWGHEIPAVSFEELMRRDLIEFLNTGKFVDIGPMIRSFTAAEELRLQNLSVSDYVREFGYEINESTGFVTLPTSRPTPPARRLSNIFGRSGTAGASSTATTPSSAASASASRASSVLSPSPTNTGDVTDTTHSQNGSNAVARSSFTSGGHQSHGSSTSGHAHNNNSSGIAAAAAAAAHASPDTSHDMKYEDVYGADDSAARFNKGLKLSPSATTAMADMRQQRQQTMRGNSTNSLGKLSAASDHSSMTDSTSNSKHHDDAASASTLSSTRQKLHSGSGEHISQQVHSSSSRHRLGDGKASRSDNKLKKYRKSESDDSHSTLSSREILLQRQDSLTPQVGIVEPKKKKKVKSVRIDETENTMEVAAAVTASASASVDMAADGEGEDGDAHKSESEGEYTGDSMNRSAADIIDRSSNKWITVLENGVVVIVDGSSTGSGAAGAESGGNGVEGASSANAATLSPTAAAIEAGESAATAGATAAAVAAAKHKSASRRMAIETNNLASSSEVIPAGGGTEGAEPPVEAAVTPHLTPRLKAVVANYLTSAQTKKRRKSNKDLKTLRDARVVSSRIDDDDSGASDVESNNSSMREVVTRARNNSKVKSLLMGFEEVHEEENSSAVAGGNKKSPAASRPIVIPGIFVPAAVTPIEIQHTTSKWRMSDGTLKKLAAGGSADVDDAEEGQQQEGEKIVKPSADDVISTSVTGGTDAADACAAARANDEAEEDSGAESDEEGESGSGSDDDDDDNEDEVIEAERIAVGTVTPKRKKKSARSLFDSSSNQLPVQNTDATVGVNTTSAGAATGASDVVAASAAVTVISAAAGDVTMSEGGKSGMTDAEADAKPVLEGDMLVFIGAAGNTSDSKASSSSPTVTFADSTDGATDAGAAAAGDSCGVKPTATLANAGWKRAGSRRVMLSTVSVVSSISGESSYQQSPKSTTMAFTPDAVAAGISDSMKHQPGGIAMQEPAAVAQTGEPTETEGAAAAAESDDDFEDGVKPELSRNHATRNSALMLGEPPVQDNETTPDAAPFCSCPMM